MTTTTNDKLFDTMINYLMTATTTSDKLFDDDKMINCLMTTTTSDKLFDDDTNN